MPETTPTHYLNTLSDCRALTLGAVSCLIDSYLPSEIAGAQANWLAWVEANADLVDAMESWQQAWYLFWETSHEQKGFWNARITWK